MNKKEYMFIAVLVVAIISIIAIFMLNGSDDKKGNTLTDAEKFASEYTQVGEDNVFVYRDIDQIINIMKNGTGVVYLGFPECKWCQAYVPMLNEVAKENEIEKIYYYDIYEERKNNTEKYQEIVAILGENLQYDNEGNRRIYVPNVSFHVKGKVIGNDCETSLDTHNFDEPSDYWTEEEKTELKKNLTKFMEEVFASSNMCTECNE